MTPITEKVATYVYDNSVKYGIYNVIASYKDLNDYNDRKVDYYEVYDDSGLCVDDDSPFYDFPTWNEIYNNYWLPSVREAEKEHTRDLKNAINQ